MQNSSFPAAPPPPPGFSPAAQQAQTTQFYQAPPAAPQSFAPPPAQQAPAYAAPPPQGFTPNAQVQAPSLNGIAVSDLNLFPQQNVNGTTRIRVTSYVKGVRGSGPAYTLAFTVEGSNAVDLQNNAVAPQGARMNMLFKISYDPKKQGGDKNRKSFVAGAFGQNPNAAIDFDAADAALQTRNFEAQPLVLEVDQRVNYNRPVKDNATQQVVPGQWWSNSSWRLVSG